MLLAVARIKLGERVGRPEAIGVLAIVAGLAVVAWAFPQHTATAPTPAGSARRYW